MPLPDSPSAPKQLTAQSVASPASLMAGDDDLLEKLEKDFKRLKQQKARPTGGVEGNILVNLCFLHDEHYVNYAKKSLGLEPKDDNKLYLTFNMIAPRFNKLLGRLSAFNGQFECIPNKK